MVTGQRIAARGAGGATLERMDVAKDLAAAMGRMRFAVEPERYTLLGFPEPPQPADLADMRAPAQLVLEPGATTLLLRAEQAAAVLSRHPAAEREENLRWIRFEAPMGWDLVGFLARVTAALAAAEVPIGAVCSFHRDHLFVAEAHLGSARSALRELFPESPPRGEEG